MYVLALEYFVRAHLVYKKEKKTNFSWPEIFVEPITGNYRFHGFRIAGRARHYQKSNSLAFFECEYIYKF